jgi:hypothetical protein
MGTIRDAAQLGGRLLHLPAAILDDHHGPASDIARDIAGARPTVAIIDDR